MSDFSSHSFKFNTQLVVLMVGAFLGATLLSLLLFRADVLGAWHFPLSYLLQFSCPLLAVYYVYRHQTGKPLQVSKQVFAWQSLLMMLPMMIGGMLFLEFWLDLIPTEGGMLGDMYQKMAEIMAGIMVEPWAIFVSVVILAPIFEELIFRGLILQSYLNHGVLPWRAILYSAFWFGFIHGNPWQFVGAFLLGLVLSYAYYRYQNIVLVMLLHAFNNGVALYLQTHEISNLNQWLHLPLWAGLVLGAVLLYFGFRLNKKLS
jgi:uncharacterized protein